MPSRSDAGPPPDEAALRQAALNHLARYSTTQAGLLRVLGRRVERWARLVTAAQGEQPSKEQMAAALGACRSAVASLAATGALDDATFAAGRSRSLRRAGRSSRAIAAHLQAKGVAPELIAPSDPDVELGSAVLYAWRRRMGPFRALPDPAQRPRDLARLARAGFPAGIAGKLLGLAAEDAEALLLEARRE